MLFPAPIFFAHQINTLKLLRAKSLIGCGAWAVQGLALCQTEGQDSGIKSQDFGGELVYIPPSTVYFGTRSTLQYNPPALKIASASKMAFFFAHFFGFSQSTVLGGSYWQNVLPGECGWAPTLSSTNDLQAPWAPRFSPELSSSAQHRHNPVLHWAPSTPGFCKSAAFQSGIKGCAEMPYVKIEHFSLAQAVKWTNKWTFWPKHGPALGTGGSSYCWVKGWFCK